MAGEKKIKVKGSGRGRPLQTSFTRSSRLEARSSLLQNPHRHRIERHRRNRLLDLRILVG